MSRIAYVNGTYLPLDEAKVSILDRGFLFADAIYEVSAVLGRRLVDSAAHLGRLARSAEAIRLDLPAGEKIAAIQRELVDRNGLIDGMIYLQLTRGAADRDFAFPVEATPTLVLFTQAKDILGNPAARTGIAVRTVPDLRWARRDIKSVALLAQVLAKQEATAHGAQEAWMVEDGFVTEGASSNAFILTREDVVVTRPLSIAILAGCTRRAVLALAEEQGLRVETRPFTVGEALAAKEAFITSASNFVLPVVTIDGEAIGDGHPGPVAARLRELYVAAAQGGT